jgi:hypothetical protein
MALVTVMLLLMTVLSLSVAFMLRANNGFFQSRNTASSIQAFFVASSGARFKAKEFESLLRTKGTIDDAVTAFNAANFDSSGAARDFALLDASGNTVGYYSVKRLVLDSPHQSDTTAAFSTPYALPYQSATISVTGSTRSSADPARTTRTVNECYNVGMAPVDALNFSYVQNNWAWWSGFATNQADLAGNSGSNGYYSVLSGAVSVAGGAPLSYNGNVYTDVAYIARSLTGTGTMNTGGGTVQQSFPQLAFPKNLSTVAVDSGPFITKAKALAQADSSTGKITEQTVIVTQAPSGTTPLLYTVVSSKDVVTGGVYSGSNENLVVGSLTATRGLSTTYLSTTNPPRVGDVMKVVSISGMVVVKGNLAVQGYFTGRGSLYAGRNIYMSGDVLYANPPSTYPSQTSPGTTSQSPSGDPGSNGGTPSGDYTSDQVLFASGKSILAGDVSNKGRWWTNDVSPWLLYKDPIGEYVNDNHEDSGVDGIVSDLDSKENDGLWTVEIRNTTTGQEQLADLPIVKNAYNNKVAQVPSGWAVVPGTGEDTDGDGLYTPPCDYDRDFNFSSRTDADGNYNKQAFSSTYFDNFPSGVSNYSDNKYLHDVHRIDGFLMANYSISGETGAVSGSNSNIVVFGGEASRADGQIAYLGGYTLALMQDQRFMSDPNASANSFIGAPMAPRIVYLQWSEQ